MEELFDYERLQVWQRAIDFAEKVIGISEKLETERKHYRLVEQVEAASTSVAMNIAEGKGRFSKKEYVQFLFYARGSLFETITLLTIFYRKSWVSKEEFNSVRSEAMVLSKMINSLIRAIKKK